MRPSQKSGRSRGKNNRSNKTAGHSPNRVYESAGPEGKVRGTPQQIIDKYLQLARDFQLSGDRVTAENCHQHAEHYTRLLSSMQEAQAERQGQNQPQNQNQSQNQQSQGEQQNQQQGGGQQAAERGRSDDKEAGQGDDQPVNQAEHADDGGRWSGDDRQERGEPRETSSEDGNFMQRLNEDHRSADALDASESESDLVETPESKAKPDRPRRARPRTRKADAPESPEADQSKPGSSREVAE